MAYADYKDLIRSRPESLFRTLAQTVLGKPVRLRRPVFASANRLKN